MDHSFLLRSNHSIPAEYRANFVHLFFDIAWFGVLSGSAMTFVAVYAARQGATGFQLGLLSASPALVNLVCTLPAARWLEKQPIGPAVFWSSALHRIFYLVWIFLPSFFTPQVQIWAFIGLTLLMSIPGTALAVGFNGLFAEVVPPQWRAHVAGVRNALLAVTLIAVSLLCGYILNRFDFPAGYQLVFGLGFLGAALSSLHLKHVVPVSTPNSNGTTPATSIRTRTICRRFSARSKKACRKAAPRPATTRRRRRRRLMSRAMAADHSAGLESSPSRSAATNAVSK